jgi:hypothetical protein
MIGMAPSASCSSCSLQAMPVPEKKYSRKRHRISAIALGIEHAKHRKRPASRKRVRNNRAGAIQPNSRLHRVTRIGIFCAGGPACKQ